MRSLKKLSSTGTCVQQALLTCGRRLFSALCAVISTYYEQGCTQKMATFSPLLHSCLHRPWRDFSLLSLKVNRFTHG